MKHTSLIKTTQILLVVLTLVMIAAPFVVDAQYRDPNPGGTGLPADTKLSEFILNIINIALGVAGLVAVLFLIIGGFRYITSAGNEEASEQAKKIILNAIIGIVVIILSFVVVRVIGQALINKNV